MVYEKFEEASDLMRSMNDRQVKFAAHYFLGRLADEIDEGDVEAIKYIKETYQ